MSKDYTLSQDEWPEDDDPNADDPELRGQGWGSWQEYRDQRKVVELEYLLCFGARWFSHNIHPRGALSKMDGHHLSIKWVNWIKRFPWAIYVFATVSPPPKFEHVTFEGWLYGYEILRLARRRLERGTLYLEGPFRPVSTLDPHEISFPRPRARVIGQLRSA